MASLPVLLVPVVLFLNWEFLIPHLANLCGPLDLPEDNPFAQLFLLSHRVPGPEPRYARGTGDIAFVAYHVVVFSLVRQVMTVTVAQRVGRFFGLRRTGKLERFGEQLYAFVYFSVFGAWGVVRVSPASRPDLVLNNHIFSANNVPTPNLVVPHGVLLDR